MDPNVYSVKLSMRKDDRELSMLAICLQKIGKGVCLWYKTVYSVKRSNGFKPFVTQKTLDTIEFE